jgi:hypothetical protein
MTMNDLTPDDLDDALDEMSNHKLIIRDERGDLRLTVKGLIFYHAIRQFVPESELHDETEE